jgi:uncharacterized membrane protein YfcA
MSITIYKAILFIIIGIITGTSVGLTGIGTGVLLIPLLIYSGMNPQETVATVLALQVVPQSFPGLYLYYKQGNLDFIKTFFVIIGSSIGIYIGSYINNEGLISQDTIFKLLSIMLALASAYIYGKHVYKSDFL